MHTPVPRSTSHITHSPPLYIYVPICTPIPTHLPPRPHHRRILHIPKNQLKPITQIPHIRIRLIHKLETLRNHLNAPIHQFRFLTRFEAEVEAAWSVSVDAELVH
ncbi:hypothetical protein ES702_00590 [subsurface metagenome]